MTKTKKDKAGITRGEGACLIVVDLERQRWQRIETAGDYRKQFRKAHGSLSARHVVYVCPGDSWVDDMGELRFPLGFFQPFKVYEGGRR